MKNPPACGYIGYSNALERNLWNYIGFILNDKEYCVFMCLVNDTAKSAK